MSPEPRFEVAYANGVERLALVVEAAALTEPEGAARLSAGLAAGLDLLASDPTLTRLLAVEALAVGHPARLAHESSLTRLAEALRRQLGGQAGGEPPTAETARILAGGLASHVSGRALAGEAERLLEDHDLLFGYLLASRGSG